MFPKTPLESLGNPVLIEKIKKQLLATKTLTLNKRQKLDSTVLNEANLKDNLSLVGDDAYVKKTLNIDRLYFSYNPYGDRTKK